MIIISLQRTFNTQAKKEKEQSPYKHTPLSENKCPIAVWGTQALAVGIPLETV